MPNIDTSTIEGFEGMTAEQKVEALLNVEIPEAVNLDGFVKKDLFDKASSELAKAKKELQGKLTEEEQKAAEQATKWAEMEEKVQKLEREKLESGYKSKYMAMPGFDEALAEDTAKAMADGNMDKVFANQKKANENYTKELEAKRAKEDPKPSGSGGNEDDGEPTNVAFARKRGKERAAAMSATNETLKKFQIT